MSSAEFMRRPDVTLAGKAEAGPASFAGDSFCQFDLGEGRAPEDGRGAPAVRHCTCLEDTQYFFNGDQQYDQAVMWTGAALGPDSGMFAEYYETPDERAGAVCQLVLHMTDVSEGTRSTIDILVWDDADGLPGDVLGLVPEVQLLTVAAYPGIGTKVIEVYERNRIGVQGGFWVGIRGNWGSDDCSLLLAVDTIDEDPGQPASSRRAATYVGPGVSELSQGWHLLEEVLGVPAATGINALVGWCPVPVQETSWGQIKRLYSGDR